MNAIGHLLTGAVGAALLMGAWSAVQRGWLRAFALREDDALAARRGANPDDNNCNGGGCAGCSGHPCANNGGS